MSSASGDNCSSYRVCPQTPYPGFAPGPHRDFSPPNPLFCGVKKILKLYSDVLCGLSVTAVFLVHLYAFNQLKPSLRLSLEWRHDSRIVVALIIYLYTPLDH